MTDQQHPTNPGEDRDNTGWVILGAVLIIAGFFLGARNLDIIPWPIGQVWNLFVKARVGIGIVLLGGLLIWWAQSGKGFRAPTSFFEQDHGILDTTRIVRSIDQPETSQNASYTLSFASDRLSWVGGLHWNRVKNMALLDSSQCENVSNFRLC